MATVNQVIGEISERLGDIALERFTKEQSVVVINAAARDLIGAGAVIGITDDESLIVSAATYEYAVPASFSHLHSVFEEGAATDTGVDLDEDLDTSEVDVDVSDGAAIATDDYIRIDSEWMLVTTGGATPLAVTRAQLGSTAATHDTGAALFRGPGTYYDWVPWQRWQLKVGTAGGVPALWFDDQLFTVNQGRRLRLLGHRRPNDSYVIGVGAIDTGLESFIRERATAISAHQLSEHTTDDAARAVLERIADNTWQESEERLRTILAQPHFRPSRYSRTVPLR